MTAFPPRPTTYDKKVGLVLQGGGALGSYQAGVYEALARSEYLPDWVAGISIGAINAAIIAGNAPADRVAKLRAFWDEVTAPTAGWPAALPCPVQNGWPWRMRCITRPLPPCTHMHPARTWPSPRWRWLVTAPSLHSLFLTGGSWVARLACWPLWSAPASKAVST